MAHLFCELFYRARASAVTERNRLALPLSLVQLGEALGMAIAKVNRTLQRLRANGSVDFRDGILTVKNWEKLAKGRRVRPSLSSPEKGLAIAALLSAKPPPVEVPRPLSGQAQKNRKKRAFPANVQNSTVFGSRGNSLAIASKKAPANRGLSSADDHHFWRSNQALTSFCA
jgi:hypothetical protein